MQHASTCNSHLDGAGKQVSACRIKWRRIGGIGMHTHHPHECQPNPMPQAPRIGVLEAHMRVNGRATVCYTPLSLHASLIYRYRRLCDISV